MIAPGYQKEIEKKTLTRILNDDRELDRCDVFLTESAKKKLIEELKRLETIKRNLLALLK